MSGGAGPRVGRRADARARRRVDLGHALHERSLVFRKGAYAGGLDLAKEPLDVLPIQFVETLELDPAPPFLVLLVVNRFRCIKGVRAFDDPALGDDALSSLDPPRTHRDASN